MPLLTFVLYLVVEVAALVWLASTVGILWTVVTVLGLSVLGLIAMRSQGRRVLGELRAANGRRVRGPADAAASAGAVTDGALVAIGSVLLLIPGLVSSVLGLLLMIPLTRAVLRPVVARVAARRVETLVASGRLVTTRSRFRSGHVVIDGDVVAEPTDPRPQSTPRVIEGTVIDTTPESDGR